MRPDTYHAIVTGGMLFAALLVAACSPPTRYRVLSFFFDGVPDPNHPIPKAPQATTQPAQAATSQPARPARPKLLAYAHPLYRDNRCDQCHDMFGGGLVRPVSEGLCNMCHPRPAPGTAFVHKPAADNDCLACHHYHASAYPGILIDAPARICLHCHQRDKLSPATHGASAGGKTCLDCHDPHGGADRFHLKSANP